MPIDIPLEHFPARPARAMVLAAGKGLRMRPLTDRIPKPLVQVAGKALLDHALDRLAEAGIGEALVNVHHLADQIEAHLAARSRPRITISDERAALLETGGGLVKALPLLGPQPFVLLNSDTMWIDGAADNLGRLIESFDDARMDALLLMAPSMASTGYDGRGDYVMDADGHLIRRGERETAPFIYAGAAILSPRLFVDAPHGAFSLTKLFDRAEEQARLFGLRLDGLWMHVGTPAAIAEAEAAIRDSTG